MFAGRALLQTVRFGELRNGLPVFPGAPGRASTSPRPLPSAVPRGGTSHSCPAALPCRPWCARGAAPLALTVQHGAVAPLATPLIGLAVLSARLWLRSPTRLAGLRAGSRYFLRSTGHSHPRESLGSLRPLQHPDHSRQAQTRHPKSQRERRPRHRQQSQ